MTETPEETPENACPVCQGELKPSEDHLTIRGDHFILRDLDAGEYEAVVRRATPPPDQDGDIPDVDMLLLRKFMVVDATTVNGEGLSLEGQSKLPQSVYAKLDGIARRRHWGEAETDEEIAARKAAAAAKIPSP